MQSDPLVSVVMSVFNGECFLREAIESILSQTFHDFEFIVVNDGSTDNTAAILDSYARSDPRVRVYHQENRGAPESWNHGCGLARGQYIARMDADDIALSDRLTRQIEFLEKHEDVGVLGGGAEYIDAKGKTLWKETRPLEDVEIRSFLLHACAFFHPTVVVRKMTFLAVGGYRQAFADAADYDLWLRVAECSQLASLPEVVLKYRFHGGQVSCSKLRQQRLLILAAQTLASLRRDGKVEPLELVEAITPERLEQLGVDRSTQQRALAGDYSYWIGCMSQALQDDAVLRMVNELMDLSQSGPVDRIILSNAWLYAARAHYRCGRIVAAVVSVARALRTRPIIAGRPVKRAVYSLLDATHELTPDGGIKRVHFRKLRFNAKKFLHDIFGASVEPH